MTYLTSCLQTYQNRHLPPLRRIDVAPFAARYMALIVGFEALRQAGSHKRLPAAARAIGAVLRAFIRAQRLTTMWRLSLRCWPVRRGGRAC